MVTVAPINAPRMAGTGNVEWLSLSLSKYLCHPGEEEVVTRARAATLMSFIYPFPSFLFFPGQGEFRPRQRRSLVALPARALPRPANRHDRIHLPHRRHRIRKVSLPG